MLIITLYSDLLDKDVDFAVTFENGSYEPEFTLTAISETLDFGHQNDMESTYCDVIASKVNNYVETNFVAI